MRIYKTKAFARWARGEVLSDQALRAAVVEAATGLYDADLGSSLLKKRIARPGGGKRGGFRTLVVTNKIDLWFFVYGFAKSERSNIDAREEAALKRLATTLMTMAPSALIRARDAGEFIEVDCDD